MLFKRNKENQDENIKKELPELTWEPAKPGEKPPKEVWIPNRRQRRAMKKSKNKNTFPTDFSLKSRYCGSGFVDKMCETFVF